MRVSAACAFDAVCGMQRCCPPPPSRKFDITFALRRIGNGILAGFAFAATLAVAVLAAPDAQAQEEPCIFEDYASVFNAGEQQMQVSLQIDNCNAKGWGAVRGFRWPQFRTCYCNIKVHDFTSGTGGCAPPMETPEINCGFGTGGGNTFCRYFFGATLQYLPEKTEENKDSCFASHCPGGQEPSGFNMNGETECACPAGHELQNGICAPTTEYLCTTSKGWIYDESDDSCVISSESPSGAVSHKCYMSGTLSPPCATIFGSNENIFRYDNSGAGESISPLVYNCDPQGTSGLIPATINTIGATTCECPALGQELNGDGVCAPIQCAEGEVLVTLEEYGHSACYAQEVVDIAEDCTAKGWDLVLSGLLLCNINFIRYFADRQYRGAFCSINPRESSVGINKCRDLFGNPPQFPTATGDADEDAKRYVTHCNAEGTIPGAIPATINTIGAKACGCDSAGGFVGDWPNCACPAGEEILADGTCGVGHEVVYSFFPATLIALVNTHSFAITPENDSSTRLGVPLTGGALRATLRAGQTIRLHLHTKPVSVSLSSNGFCEAEFSGHGTANNAYTNCDLIVTSAVNIELYLLPTVAGTPPPPRRARVAGLADPADGTGGTVATAGEVSAGGWADAGTLVTFTATPAEGWYVGDWEGDGGRCQATGDRDTTGAAGAQTCALAADDDLLVTAGFARPGAVFTVVFSYAPATLALAPNDLAIVSDATPRAILATLSDGRAVAKGIEANSTINLYLQNAPAGYGVESVSSDECRARFTGFHGGLPEPERGPERGPSNGSEPCAVQVNRNLDVMVTFAPLADCEERNLPLIEAADGPRVYNRLLCGECPVATPPDPPTHRLVGDYCVPLSEDFGTLSDKALCRIFGGNMDEGEDVCSGMDANDTFCIMDAEDVDSVLAFPCRGLFKHLRSCNLTHNRKALNPFFCGARCAGQKAVGKDCVSL